MEVAATTILLVEDEALIALAEKTQLERVGYRVIQAATGEKAISLVAANPNAIDLILMDIDLGPGIYGTEAAQEILKTHEIPVLFLSSHTDPKMVKKTEEITNYGYVVKASSFTVLDASIKMALRLFEANAKLAHSNDKFAKIFQSNPDYVAISSLDDGVFLDVNDGFVDMMGYSRDEVVGKSAVTSSVAIWVEPEERKQFAEFLLRDRRISDFHTRLRKKDGGILSVVASARLLEIDGRDCLIAVVKDVTEQEKVNRALRESEERFRLAMEATTDGLWDWDSFTGKTYYSPAYTGMLGYGPEEFRSGGEDWNQHIHPHDLAGVARTNELCESGALESFTMEFRLRAKDGSWKWIHSRGKAVGHGSDGRALRVIGTHVDITQSKQMESLLRASEAKYRLLYDTAGDAIFIYDLKGRILSANLTARERLGLGPEEILKLGLSDIDDPAEAEKIPERLEKILKDGYLEYRIVQRRKDGSSVPVAANARLIEWEGRPAILSLCRDISDQVRDEERIGRLLKEKDLVLRESFHRIKNNMATVASYLSLKRDCCSDPAAMAILDDSISQVRGMEVLLDKLYHVEGQGELALGEYLPVLLEEILGVFPSTKVKLHLELEDLRMDAKRLSTLGVLLNELITNSMKYAFAGLTEPAIFISATQAEGRIRLVYRDNGRGLPEGFSMEASRGFGMQLVQGLAAQLGGRIRAESDGGARFTLDIGTTRSPTSAS